jgi:uncharacterized protein YjbI with pentapeptide repeats
VVDALKRSTAPASPFGFTEAGLKDLRGLELPLGGMTLRGLEAGKVDFSGSNLHSLVLISSRLADCDLSATDLRLMSNASEIYRCRFDSARMATSVMTGSARFYQCSFVGTDLTGGIFKQGLFEECDFTRATLDKLNVSASMRACTLSGDISGSFLRGKFEGCNFLGASFLDCALYGATFRECQFGPNTLLFTRWPPVLKALAEAKENHGLSAKALGRFARKMRAWELTLPQVKHQVVDLKEFVSADGEEIGPQLFDFVRQVSATVAAA